MKNNSRLVGAVVTPLPANVAYTVFVCVTDGDCEAMVPTHHGSRSAPSNLPTAARLWASKLGLYVQLHAYPFGIVASAWPKEKEHA